MGTSGIAFFHKGGADGDVLCAVHKQSDGYPSGFGDQIAAILGPLDFVNGLLMDRDWNTLVNGVGCAAARLVACTKERAGGIYMISPNTDWADCEYHIFFDGDEMNPPKGAKLSMRLCSGKKTLWEGLVSDFDGEAVENAIDGAEDQTA